MSVPPEEFSPDAAKDAGHPLVASSDGSISPPSPAGDRAPNTPAFEHDVPPAEEPLFVHYEYVPPHPPPRSPNLLDLLLFVLLAIGAFFCSAFLAGEAVHFHLFGVSSLKQANDDIHYRLGSQALSYLFILLFCVWIFSLVWRKGFFEGVSWQAGQARRKIGWLLAAAGGCFVAAIADEVLIPGPPDTPIDKTFHLPGAIWLLFGFGVTLAPLIEEIAYRGFLLPSMCTAYDWMVRQLTGSKSTSREANGRQGWSLPAMVVASVVTSIPFALMHGEQTGYSIGPFLLLVSISLVLCWIRLATRSLAASVLVHSSYNLLLFALMFLGTGGFRHLDRM